jgi:HPt (histidine-containing phosphotransfer) domain-containing protein
VANSDDDLLQKMRALEGLFAAKLPARFRELDAARRQCVEQFGDHEHLKTLYRLLHTLAGSAGTFGFDELGLQARRMENRLSEWLARGNWTQQDLAQVELALEEMKRGIPESPTDADNGSRS